MLKNMIVADALWGERGGNGHGEVDVYSFFLEILVGYKENTYLCGGKMINQLKLKNKLL
ncbi:MAG: hypothetical protein IJP75_05715 [Bacteroidaceae bacterium]|nr:hypothetical protein [Bacteroidaceae bacterium]